MFHIVVLLRSFVNPMTYSFIRREMFDYALAQIADCYNNTDVGAEFSINGGRAFISCGQIVSYYYIDFDADEPLSVEAQILMKRREKRMTDTVDEALSSMPKFGE